MILPNTFKNFPHESKQELRRIIFTFWISATITTTPTELMLGSYAN